MSLIHYFPRYSQKENMVTNNTMLLFKRLSNNSNEKFNRFLNSILENSGINLDMTVKFGQQEKGNGSVPDAYIQQETFKILIETKLYGQQNISQIKNHFSEFNDEKNQIFLWINNEPIKEVYRLEIVEALNKFNALRIHSISFASVTFKEICEIFNDTLTDYDFEMKEMIQDYEAFCIDTNLIDNFDSKIRFVATGTTFKQNLEYNIYYDPRSKGYQNHKYIGIYTNKAVRGIGEIICIVDVDYNNTTDDLKVISTQFGVLTNEQKSVLKKVIKEAYSDLGYDIAYGERFFFVDKFYETNFIKTSKNGMMGKRYYDVSTLDGYRKDMNAEKIADLLRAKEWG
ncbi:hypothetical protein [Desulfosporosinus nitroreducens]|uniref:Restriction endonuclease n=1 Tax=Desulfosporosinus nitroreducens TaxID=2018668 RepID=A0ABT8QR11_9FIRM|nr:hypothetical protein [Desulfosporosinus nitroreducens]MDO0823080.1 hypothetical protein [Desulfosporosinus nitroreducens]